MATHEHAERSTSRNVAAALGRFVLIGVFTGVETLALGVWLTFVVDAPLVSRATAIGLGVLLGGLVVEHFLTDVAVNGYDASIPGGKVLTFSVTETALWALWLVVAERVGGLEGILAAGLVLTILLVPQHTVEDSVLRGRGLLADLFDLNALGFSIVEAGGATVWLLFVLRGDLVTPLLADADALVGGHLPIDVAALDPALVGLAVLAAALFVEHNIGVSFSRHGDSSRDTSSSQLR